MSQERERENVPGLEKGGSLKDLGLAEVEKIVAWINGKSDAL